MSSRVAGESVLSRFIWDKRYRYRDPHGKIIDQCPDATWRRVASALARRETGNREYWENLFYGVLKSFRFIPGGRILAGAGVDRPATTLFNCFVMGAIKDPEESVVNSLRESARTLGQGGGIGCDFSTLLPQGARISPHYPDAPGPVAAMHRWDDLSASTQHSARRGAMMAVLRCDHPDIENFIDAQYSLHQLHNFNLSVLVTDDFMTAVERNEEWPLVFPLAQLPDNTRRHNDVVMRRWPGEQSAVPCRVLRRLPAQKLWDKIMRSNFDHAEPGMLFIDRINHLNNLWYCETISCTNPCGEIPLPAYGACNLGSINLGRFVNHPFSNNASLDMEGIRHTACVATRMLDNVIDISTYPLEQQKVQATGARRIGLGMTGLADALIQLRLHYASPEAQQLAAAVMRTIQENAYRSSIDLAREKGEFPFLNRELFLAGAHAQCLPDDIRSAISNHGIRNSHLTAIAPAGSISLLAGNVSSGIEPVFSYHYQQRILCGVGRNTNKSHGTGNGTDDSGEEGVDVALANSSYQLWRDRMGSQEKLPGYFVTAHELAPEAHLAMVSVLQPYVDNAISKTVNLPENISFHHFSDIYRNAYRLGLKGCSTFRYNSITAAPVKRP